MGRPLNKKFFGNAADKLLASAAMFGSGGTPEAVSIVRQRSNLKYEVQAEVAESSATLTVGARYLIVALGSADFTTVGAASNTVGTVFTATGTNAGAGGTAAQRDVCTLTDSTPNAVGEMTIEVTPENAVAPAEAQIDFGTTGGVVDSVTIVDGGYGYWTGGTFNISVASDGGFVAGTEATITYTVANGSIDSLVITDGGTGYTADLPNTTDVNTADIPNQAANPPVQFARIINAHLVKTFEGNTYAWPALAPVGGFRGLFSEADLELQA